MSSGNGPTFLVIATIVLMFVCMAFFAIVMKRPTMRGRALLDELIGFKDYLEIAEKDELNLRNPPEKTPELFESLLPKATSSRSTGLHSAVASSARAPGSSSGSSGGSSGGGGGGW